MKTLVRPNIATLEPYRCARDDFKEGVLLDANENTHGPALESVSAWEDALELNRYPDPHQIELKQQIVDFRNATPNAYAKPDAKIGPANLCLGVGSDESIDMLLRCVCVPSTDKLLVCPPTYGMYSICATVNAVELVKVPLVPENFQLDLPAIKQALAGDPRIKLAYFTSPGNPTAKLLKVSDIIELLEYAAQNWNGLVVVDEAYIDFTPQRDGKSESMATLVNTYPNLVVMQTLSKSFGLAGIRLGVTYASTELAGYLSAMKYPYNISSLTSAIALRATSGSSGLPVMQKYVDLIVEQRDIVLQKLLAIPGIGKNIGGLDANFVLVQILDKAGVPLNDVAHKLYNTLAVERGVVVRFRGKELNCDGALRMSIGTAEENKVLLERLAELLPQIRGA